MAAKFRWAILIPLACTGLALAQTPPTKDGPKRPPNEAEVRFGDGSVLRVEILQPTVEVLTRYGKLTVPIGEIRRVELGQHVSEAARQRIDNAVRQLGSTAYREREQAVRLLAAEGVLALSALEQASKSRDLEVAHRAEAAIKQIREKSPEEARRFRIEDLIETTEFPIVGRIVNPVLKARTTYFGEVDLRLPELRQVSFRGTAGDRDLTVDAAKFGSAQGQWMDTGYEVSSLGRLKITASGSIDLWPQTPGQYMSTPKGYSQGANTSSTLPGMLLGRVGESGRTFNIGDTFEGQPSEKGRLYLHIVPSPWNNASIGSYRVRIMASLLPHGGS